MPTESAYRKKLVPALKALNFKVIPYVGSRMGLNSTCDVWIGGKIQGHIVQAWVEFKGGHTRITDGQLAEQVDLHKKGIDAWIVRFVESDYKVQLIYIKEPDYSKDLRAVADMRYENDSGRLVHNWHKCAINLLRAMRVNSINNYT